MLPVHTSLRQILQVWWESPLPACTSGDSRHEAQIRRALQTRKKVGRSFSMAHTTNSEISRLASLSCQERSDFCSFKNCQDLQRCQHDLLAPGLLVPNVVSAANEKGEQRRHKFH